MNLPTPVSIESAGGLQAWLDSNKSKHNGHGYADFIERVYVLKEPKMVVARAFNLKTKKTVYDWMAIHEREASHAES